MSDLVDFRKLHPQPECRSAIKSGRQGNCYQSYDTGIFPVEDLCHFGVAVRIRTFW